MAAGCALTRSASLTSFHRLEIIMVPAAERSRAEPSLTRAAVGFFGSTFVTASLMVLLSAISG
jgi:hypothetical protein